MNTLTVTNEQGTIFEYSKDGEFLIVTVTKGDSVNVYKTYSKNKIKEGKLLVCRENGSWVDMPVFDEKAVNEFKDGRTKHVFETAQEMVAFRESNNCGESFAEFGRYAIYKYSR